VRWSLAFHQQPLAHAGGSAIVLLGGLGFAL
jgi:hypothetical protein